MHMWTDRLTTPTHPLPHHSTQPPRTTAARTRARCWGRAWSPSSARGTCTGGTRSTARTTPSSTRWRACASSRASWCVRMETGVWLACLALIDITASLLRLETGEGRQPGGGREGGGEGPEGRAGGHGGGPLRGRGAALGRHLLPLHRAVLRARDLLQRALGTLGVWHPSIDRSIPGGVDGLLHDTTDVTSSFPPTDRTSGWRCWAAA